MRNFLLNYLHYRDSNRIIIYIDCNRIIKGSLKYVYRPFKGTVYVLISIYLLLRALNIAFQNFKIYFFKDYKLKANIDEKLWINDATIWVNIEKQIFYCYHLVHN